MTQRGAQLKWHKEVGSLNVTKRGIHQMSWSKYMDVTILN